MTYQQAYTLSVRAVQAAQREVPSKAGMFGTYMGQLTRLFPAGTSAATMLSGVAGYLRAQGASVSAAGLIAAPSSGVSSYLPSVSTTAISNYVQSFLPGTASVAPKPAPTAPAPAPTQSYFPSLPQLPFMPPPPPPAVPGAPVPSTELPPSAETPLWQQPWFPFAVVGGGVTLVGLIVLLMPSRAR